MSDEAIADTVEAFGRAAATGRRLGFDAVEIHAAHGCLIDQFFWGGTNLRGDVYGGDTLGARTRLASEVVRSVRKAVGPDFPVFLRISQWKAQDFGVRLATSPAAMAEWLSPLADAGVDVLHCSQRRFWEPEFPEIDGPDGLNFAGWAKKLTALPAISVGSVGLSGEFMAALAGENSAPTSLDDLVLRMEREEFDLIAVGRALIGDPLWPEKVRRQDWKELRGFNATALGELI